jgi:LuxR family maltose regulon positive regulatory protein
MHALRGRVEACIPLVARLAALQLEAARLNWGDMAALLDIQLGLAQAYAAAAGKDWPQVIAVLDSPGRLADERKRGRDALQIRLLRALARKRCGDDGGTLLAEVVSLAEMSGFKRILADTHPDLPEWAHQISHPEPSGTDDRIAEAPAIHVRPASTAKVLPSSLLTAKEQQILQLLAGTLTNKQIALALGVGDQTIKWHLKNLFAKLGAGTRRHALDRARMLGILETAN